jgi:hypothetical protein
MYRLKHLAGFSPQVTDREAELVAENRLGNVFCGDA